MLFRGFHKNMVGVLYIIKRDLSISAKLDHLVEQAWPWCLYSNIHQSATTALTVLPLVGSLRRAFSWLLLIFYTQGVWMTKEPAIKRCRVQLEVEKQL
jgi:hypothetical protein